MTVESMQQRSYAIMKGFYGVAGKECVNNKKKILCLFFIKKYVVGTQKNHLNDMLQ